ncbi:YkgJ family cysteine cluster protein [Marinomonas ostreistagni]|uniref:YkgJ family cysteine cluster protein n=1 Tax=Marinomonas ostreistagni TaxID=359209 RepID=A0ABS0Z7G5_9GAMM|nr:YkgJ family cysteine cluster protein [Marinomonas ostreistagni]MBJ7549574.1 YkgJ family cysteine cluster protein [Marinomonas ostreistagni]
MNCRPYCGACCIAPSITSPIPGMPNGKPAGVPCIQLDKNYHCKIFGQPDRPAVCAQFEAVEYVCGEHRSEAISTLNDMEAATLPNIIFKDKV